MRTTIVLVSTVLLVALSSPLSAGSLAGTVKCVGARHNADAVVYVERIAGKTFPPPAAHAQMDQKDMVFVPHVLPVLVGTTVDFLNSDPIPHNVFTPDKCAERFNLGTWPTGQVKSYAFKQACAATLLCKVHPEMEAFVVAVPTPYFAVTDKSGSFAINDLPDGTYTVRVWHPKLPEASQKVTVSGDTEVNFELAKKK